MLANLHQNYFMIIQWQLEYKSSHPFAHVYTPNGLVEALTKRLQIITHPMLLRTELPTSPRSMLVCMMWL